MSIVAYRAAKADLETFDGWRRIATDKPLGGQPSAPRFQITTSIKNRTDGGAGYADREPHPGFEGFAAQMLLTEIDRFADAYRAALVERVTRSFKLAVREAASLITETPPQ